MSAERCGATTVFWPDDECVDVGPCILGKGHKGDHREAVRDIVIYGRTYTFRGSTWDNEDASAYDDE